MKRFSKKHTLKIYEVNCFGDLKLSGLFNILQEIASEHADSLKLGYQTCCALDIAWVAASYHVKIYRLPKLDETVQIETWICDCAAFTSQRCYRMKDLAGNILLEGLTNWALIDLKTLRPVLIEKKLAITPDVIDGEKLSFSNEKIRLTPLESGNFESHLIARFDEMDTNLHINNAFYPTWATESLPQNWQEEKVPTEIQINFKNPTKAFEKVDVLTSVNSNESLHNIAVANEIKALIKINWKEKKI